VALARTRMLAGLWVRKSGEGFYSYDDKAAALRLVPQPAALPTDATFWWPMDGPAAVPDSIAALLPAGHRRPDAGRADVIVVAPLGRDLSTTIEDLQLVIADSLGYVAHASSRASSISPARWPSKASPRART
jgi:3-hydroxybutyryl-CoA dehydrogenase